MGEENVEEAKGNCFKRAEEENQTETSEESWNKSWSSNAQKIKERDSQDNMEVTSNTEPIANCQSKLSKDHKINVTQKI